MIASTSRSFSLVVCFIALVAGVSNCLGQAPIEFLPIAVPQTLFHRLDELGVKALPEDREKFEQRIHELNAKYRALTDPVGTRILAASYTARLDGDNFVDGQASLQIKHALPERGYVRLTPLTLAVRSLRWRDDAAAPVEAGLINGQEFAAAVTGDNTLEFDWSQAGSRNPTSALEFNFALPNAAINELVLDLPESQQPTCAIGIVTALGEETAAADESMRELATGYRRWRIALGMRSEATVRVLRSEDLAQQEPFVLARSTNTYLLDTAGLEVRALLSSTAHRTPLDRLTIDVGDDLQIGSIVVDGEAARFHEIESAAPTRSFEIIFPRAVSGEVELTVTAFARTRFGEPWTLPTIHVRDVLWADGTMRLEAADHKLLKRLRTDGSILKRIEPLPAPRMGDVHHFELLRQDGTCELMLERPQQQWQSRLFTSIRLNEDTATARVTAHLISLEQASFVLRVQRDSDWRFDSIETDPADLLQEQIVRGARGQIRELRLARAATTDAPVTLVVRARRKFTAGARLRGIDLRPVAFPDAKLEANIIAVAATAPLQLVTSMDAEVQRVDEQSLSATDQALLVSDESAITYRDGASADDLRVAAVRALPRFRTRAAVDVTAQSDAIRFDYLLQCQPIASRLSRLRVRFTHPHQGPIQWSIVGERDGAVQALRTEDRGTWELELADPHNVQFHVRATVNAPLVAAFPIPLVSVPEADTQVGTLTIGSNDGTKLAIDHRGLTAVPIDRSQPQPHTQTQGVFRYAPSQDAFVGVQEVVPAAEHNSWVRLVKLTSRFNVGGRVSHHAELHVRNYGADRFLIQLPESATDRRVTVGNNEVLWADTSAKLSVPLPADQEAIVIDVRYDQEVQAGAVSASVRPAIPEFDVAALDWRWRVLLPPGYRATQDPRTVTFAETDRWDTRLLGYSVIRDVGRPWNIFSADSWNAIGRSRGAAAPTDAEGDNFAAASAGWTVIDLRLNPNSAAPLTIYRKHVLSGFSWAGFFVMLAIISWLARREQSIVFVLLAVTILAGLFVPAGFAFLFRGALWGALAGVVFTVLRMKSGCRLAADDDRSVTVQRAANASIAMMLIAATTSLQLGARSLAQDTAQPGQDDVRLHRVYYVSDEDGKPVDDRYYVPDAFRDALDRIEAELKGAQMDWLIKACDYSTTIEDDAGQLRMRALMVDLEVVTSGNATELHLPFRKQEVQLLSATLDDQLENPSWAEDGEHIVLPIKQAGLHRLSLKLRPIIRTQADRLGFDIAAPTLPTSRLTVRGLNPTVVDITHHIGIMSSDMPEQRLTVELGAAPRLAISWPADAETFLDPPVVSCSQYVWLRPSSGLLTVDALLKLDVVAGHLRQVEVQADPRLRMLPLADDRLVQRVRLRNGEENELLLFLSRDYLPGDSVTLQLSFVMPVDSVEETVTGPMIRIRGMPAKQVMIGLSSRGERSSSLSSADAAVLPAEEFSSAWNVAQAPQQALLLTDPQGTWTLELGQVASRLSVREEVDLVVGRASGDIVYRAELDVSGQAVAQLELKTPPDFEIDNVQIVQEDTDVVRRWISDGSGVATVQLTRALVGTARVTLEGTIALSKQQQLDFVPVRLNEAAGTRTTRVFRRPQTLVTIGSLGGHEQLPPASVADRHDARIVAVLRETTETITPISVNVKPNAAIFSGELATTLGPDSAGWTVRADLSLRVLNGVLDKVRWRLPRELAANASIEPPYPFEIKDEPGQAEVVLLVAPPEAVRGDLQLRLTAPLATPDGGRIGAPDIEILDSTRVRRSLVLPTKFGAKTIAWDTRGLDRPVRSADQVTYQVTGSRMQATIRETLGSAALPSVLLADVAIDWRPDGSYWGVADFDVLPGGRAACQLHVPQGVQVVRIAVSGLTSVTTTTEDTVSDGGANELRIPLAMPQLPQRLRVLFKGETEPTASHRTRRLLAVPSISDIDVRRTLWTLHRSRPSHLPLLSHTIHSRPEIDEVRRQHLVRILELGEQASSQQRADDYSVWRGTWSQRLKQLEAGESLAAGVLGGVGMPETGTPTHDVHCAFEGPAATLTLVRENPSLPGLLRRVVAACLLMTVLALVFIARSWHGLWEFIAAWPHFIGVACGLVWWLWLAPSFVGWIIVAISLISVARPAWPGRPVRVR